MPHPLGNPPSKIIAVHLNFRSRAAERGRIPAHPSYFLKPPSSLAGTQEAIVRPRGCRLMGFEGEVALVIGSRARRVRPEDGWRHVRWVTAANDAGVYDLRYADRGSNLRSKGADGFTPIGPRLLDATELDPGALRLRTWVNGELVQDDTTDTLLFPFGELVADLSRLVTLEPGDVILTGTPAGASVVQPGDVVEVEVADGRLSTGVLRSPIADADHALDPWGAQPRTDRGEEESAYGPAYDPGPLLDENLAGELRSVAVATISAQLRRRGLAHMSVDAVHPATPGTRMVGVAHTLRYLPLREDLFEKYGTGMNAQKRAIEGTPARTRAGDGRPAGHLRRNPGRHPRPARPATRRGRGRDRRRAAGQRGRRRSRTARVPRRSPPVGPRPPPCPLGHGRAGRLRRGARPARGPDRGRRRRRGRRTPRPRHRAGRRLPGAGAAGAVHHRAGAGRGGGRRSVPARADVA
ncbi:5-carboxymethyl-2-hydroxymuconate delta-isomerase [Streptomyces sp. NL15-2K]|nr:5-carboxymethyl-2-hydroxymuconate delta-isomerase [Streptomyces sp. NL15-2K]